MEFIEKYRSYIFIFLLAVLHIILGTKLNLSDDGAYYWVWSQHLGLSYYDHPPMIAYIIRFFTFIFGNNNFAVRLTSVMAIAISSIYIHKIIIYLYKSQKKAFLAVIVFNIIPFFSMISILVLPDLPLYVFYTMGLYYFFRLIYERNSRLWYIIGVLTGLGLLSKYNMVLVYPGIFLYLLLHKEEWYWFKKKDFYLSFLISLLIFFPVIIWNMNHNWVSFAFQFLQRHNSGGGQLNLRFDNFIVFFLIQLIIVSPLLFISFFSTMFKNIHKKDVKIAFFYGMPVFAVFQFSTLFTNFKVHWAAMAYIPFLIIWVKYTKWKKFMMYFGIGLAIILSLFFYTQSLYPIIKINPGQDITTDMHGWDKVGQEVQEIYNNKDRDDWFLFSNRYQVTSQLYFYLPEKNYVYSINKKIEQYDFWSDEEVLIGKNGIFVTHTFYKVDPVKLYQFDKINLLKKIDILRAGQVCRTFYIYECINYKGKK